MYNPENQETMIQNWGYPGPYGWGGCGCRRPCPLPYRPCGRCRPACGPYGWGWGPRYY